MVYYVFSIDFTVLGTSRYNTGPDNISFTFYIVVRDNIVISVFNSITNKDCIISSNSTRVSGITTSVTSDNIFNVSTKQFSSNGTAFYDVILNPLTNYTYSKDVSFYNNKFKEIYTTKTGSEAPKYAGIIESTFTCTELTGSSIPRTAITYMLSYYDVNMSLKIDTRTLSIHFSIGVYNNTIYLFYDSNNTSILQSTTLPSSYSNNMGGVANNIFDTTTMKFSIPGTNISNTDLQSFCATLTSYFKIGYDTAFYINDTNGVIYRPTVIITLQSTITNSSISSLIAKRFPPIVYYSSITNYKVYGNDFGSQFCDLTNNQKIDGNKTFSNAITTKNGTIQSSVPRVSLWLGGFQYTSNGNLDTDLNLIKYTSDSDSFNNLGFDDNTHKFICPIKGYYEIIGNITIRSINDTTSPGEYTAIKTYINNTLYDETGIASVYNDTFSTGVGAASGGLSNLLYLNLNDEVKFKIYTVTRSTFDTYKQFFRINISYVSS
jgi:hypothetical protein